MSGLIDLPKTKWPAGGDNKILNQDFVDIENGILEVVQKYHRPTLTWVDNSSIRIKATTDSVANCMMLGFPNAVNPGGWVNAGSDQKLRYVSTDTDMDFDASSTFWGTEKASQWYAIYTLATSTQTNFSLKAMPIMRVSSYTGTTITIKNNLNTADIGYGFTTNELVGYRIYFISGAFAGMLKTISANNNSTTASTITYSGSTLPLAVGDWFVILPSTNFRWLGDIYNNASANILQFRQVGDTMYWYDESQTLSMTSSSWAEGVGVISPIAREIYLSRITGAAHSASSGFFITDYVNSVKALEYDSDRAEYYQNSGLWIPIANCRYREAQTWSGWTAVIGGFRY